jgi:hypothetical protein
MEEGARMADAQFFADEVTLAQRRKRFTIAEANATLPLVSRIAHDIMRTHAWARSLHAQLEASPSQSKRIELETDLDIAADRLETLADELADIGCEIKDFRLGLVDFVAAHAGRDVYLCWRPGETTITHWHELDAGFAGRQPIELMR